MAAESYNVGIYCRLSNDDERAGESLSIENQKLMLREYVQKQGWNEYDVYCDDGYSGVTFDRPAVQRLIRDAKAKKINLILVKDLSRFGRDHIACGYYTECLFGELGCRFIALNNGVDTGDQTHTNNDLMGFLNLFNEFYSRDNSRKIRAARKTCAKNGKFTGAVPPYGYQIDPANKHHLIVNRETAPIVQRIYQMRASGQGYRKIAQQLTEEGVMTPKQLHQQQSDLQAISPGVWSEQTIRNIIHNEVYLGNMIQGKRKRLSYKSKKIITKPEQEWIRVEHMHEAIVSQEIWDVCADMTKKRVRKSPTADGIKSIFTGLVYCADCGKKMRNHIVHYKTSKGVEKRYSTFICSSYSNRGKEACTIHRVMEDILNQFVLEDIQKSARAVSLNKENIAQQLQQMCMKENEQQLAQKQKTLKEHQKRLDEIGKLIRSVYEDKCSGIIDIKMAASLIGVYERERREREDAVSKILPEIQEQETTNDDILHWLNIISQYSNITKLDERILFQLLDRIEVKQIQNIDGKQTCQIKLQYRYINQGECIEE